MAERPSVFRAFDQFVGLQSPKLLVGGSSPSRPAKFSECGGMEDAQGLGPCAERRVGSTPTSSIIIGRCRNM